MKSLVAEDDATSRKLLHTFLSRYGECDIATDGEEAVNAVRLAHQNRQNYDLICMDIRMPKMDGQVAIQEIRKLEAATGITKTARIIMTTADSNMDTFASALLGRCNAYMVKPIDITKLIKELKAFGLVQ